MKRNWKWFRAAALVALLVLNAGCSGIHAQKSISILDLLWPGITKSDVPAEQVEREFEKDFHNQPPWPLFNRT